MAILGEKSDKMTASISSCTNKNINNAFNEWVVKICEEDGYYYVAVMWKFVAWPMTLGFYGATDKILHFYM